MNENGLISRGEKEAAAAVFPRKSRARRSYNWAGAAAVIHDASFTVELRGGPGRGTKAICRSLYCRIVHTGAQLCRPG